jgi:hypothetical protein
MRGQRHGQYLSKDAEFQSRAVIATDWQLKATFKDLARFHREKSGGSLSRVAAVYQQIHVLKFGINYRFGWGKTPAPIAAKY